MIYDPTANPAKNFGAFSKKIINKAEELGADKIEFIDEYIKYLRALINGEKAETEEEISLLANTPKGFLNGLIKYLEKMKVRFKAVAKKEVDKAKLEEEKEEIREEYSKIFQRLREEFPDSSKRIEKLKELLETKKKEKGKFNKTILEEIQKEIDKTEKLKEKEEQEIRDNWFQYLEKLSKDIKKLETRANYLQSLLEKQTGKYSNIIREEIKKELDRIKALQEKQKESENEEEAKIQLENAKVINRNRQYLMNILYFTNGFVTIAQESLISEFGRTFSLDLDEYERFSKLNGEVRRELRGTEEEQIKSLVKKKILSLPAEERTKIVQEIEEVLKDKMCEEMLFDMKMIETKYRSAKRMLDGWYTMALPHNQDKVKEEARKDLIDAEERRKDLDFDDSPVSLKLNKILASDSATDILVLKLREREIERRKPRYAGEGR